ncbi:hypothetical protein QFZ70_003542 [Arthrobacter sp. V1I9]|jgi:hypothetical protein|nr:hypothetical protein [Arthrobacter sp. V1I9]
MITVTYLSPRRVCRQTCSSTPISATPLNRAGSAINTRLPSARIALFAVCQGRWAAGDALRLHKNGTSHPDQQHDIPTPRG